MINYIKEKTGVILSYNKENDIEMLSKVGLRRFEWYFDNFINEYEYIKEKTDVILSYNKENDIEMLNKGECYFDNDINILIYINDLFKMDKFWEKVLQNDLKDYNISLESYLECSKSYVDFLNKFYANVIKISRKIKKLMHFDNIVEERMEKGYQYVDITEDLYDEYVKLLRNLQNKGYLGIGIALGYIKHPNSNFPVMIKFKKYCQSEVGKKEINVFSECKKYDDNLVYKIKLGIQNIDDFYKITYIGK